MVSTSKSVLMPFRVIRLYDIKNEQWENSAAHVGTVSQTVRSGNGPYKEKYHARLEPFSRFFPSHNLIIQKCGQYSCNHGFTEL